MPAGYGESLFHRIAVGPGEVIAMTYAVDPGMPELAAEVEDLARTDLPGLAARTSAITRADSRCFGSGSRTTSTESGLPTAPDEIVVTSGAHQAIALVTQMYLRTGAAVVIEQPSWPGCFDLFGAAGGRVVGVPLDDAGIRPDLLAAAFAEHQPAMLFVMPTFHNPTGRLMSSARRRQVAELAAKYGVVVVEDNAYSAWDPSRSGDPAAAGRLRTAARRGADDRIGVEGGLGWIADRLDPGAATARGTIGPAQGAGRSRQPGDRPGTDRATAAPVAPS